MNRLGTIFSFFLFILHTNNSNLLSNTKMRILRIKEKILLYLRTQLQHLFCRFDPSLHGLFFLQVLRLHCILPFWKKPQIVNFNCT